MKIALEFWIRNLFGIWSWGFWILGLLQQPYDFHVKGLWKHVDQTKPLHSIAPF